MKAPLPVLSQDADSQIVTDIHHSRQRLGEYSEEPRSKRSHLQTPAFPAIVVIMFGVYLYKRAASQGPQYLWWAPLTLQMETKQNKTYIRGKGCEITALPPASLSLTSA